MKQLRLYLQHCLYGVVFIDLRNLRELFYISHVDRLSMVCSWRFIVCSVGIRVVDCVIWLVDCGCFGALVSCIYEYVLICLYVFGWRVLVMFLFV